jgi:hypothetical protein
MINQLLGGILKMVASEAHGAMKKERHVCARRQDGEPAVS